jgi:GH43 family beta-xylosidase
MFRISKRNVLVNAGVFQKPWQARVPNNPANTPRNLISEYHNPWTMKKTQIFSTVPAIGWQSASIRSLLLRAIVNLVNAAT